MCTYADTDRQGERDREHKWQSIWYNKHGERSLVERLRQPEISKFDHATSDTADEDFTRVRFGNLVSNVSTYRFLALNHGGVFVAAYTPSIRQRYLRGYGNGEEREGVGRNKTRQYLPVKADPSESIV